MWRRTHRHLGAAVDVAEQHLTFTTHQEEVTHVAAPFDDCLADQVLGPEVGAWRYALSDSSGSSGRQTASPRTGA